METEPPKERKKATTQETFKRLREKSKAEALEKRQKIADAQDRAKTEAARKKKRQGKGNISGESTRKKPRAIASPKERNIRTPERKKPRKLVTSGTSPISSTSLFPRSPAPTTKKPECPSDTDKRRTAMGQHCQRKRRRGCTNCCGGLPGRGPRSAREGYGGHCCCSSENRMRGGSDTDRSMNVDPSRDHQFRSSSEDSRAPEAMNARGCGHSSRLSMFGDEARSRGGHGPQSDISPIRERREAGGCGTCGVPPPACYRPCRPPSACHRPCRPPSACHQPCRPPSSCQKQVEFRCNETSRPSNKGGGCPCGSCGGSACFDNPGGGGAVGGCCGGNRSRGMPCKCKCQSCDTFRPLGGCGGQSCGKIYSCAGSGGGRCCFPRNSKRRSGPDCCGGADPNCGGCC